MAKRNEKEDVKTIPDADDLSIRDESVHDPQDFEKSNKRGMTTQGGSNPGAASAPRHSMRREKAGRGDGHTQSGGDYHLRQGRVNMETRDKLHQKGGDKPGR